MLVFHFGYPNFPHVHSALLSSGFCLDFVVPSFSPLITSKNKVVGSIYKNNRNNSGEDEITI